MTLSARVFIAGARGTAGSAIAARLKADGHAIIASTSDAANERHLEKLGYEAVTVDLADAGEVDLAIRDSGPDFVVNAARGRKNAAVEEPLFAQNLADASEASGIKGMIYVSVFHADKQSGVPHFDVKAEIEAALATRPFPIVSLRAPTFMNLLVSPMVLGGIADKGVFASPSAPETRIGYLHADDLAKVASYCIKSAFKPGIFTLAGPEALTPVGISNRFSSALNKPIEVQQIPVDAIKQRAGPDLAAMAEYLNAHNFVVTQPQYPDGFSPELISFDTALIRKATQ